MGAVRQPLKDEEPSLYDRDFVTWTELMSSRLRDRHTSDLDWDNLAEEIESLGKSDRRALRSNLRVLMMHLLKWKVQPELRSGSWKGSIIEHRRRINELLEDSPSLGRDVPEMIRLVYGEAIQAAMTEAGLLQNPFPEDCPFDQHEVLDIRFWPG